MWKWIAAALAAFGIVGWASRSKKRGDLAPPGSRVLLVGDSLAVGLTRPLGELVKADGSDFRSDAIGGTMIRQWASSTELALTLTTFRPTLVLVSLGTNDAYSLDAGAGEEAALAKLVSRLRSNGAELVWIGPPTLPKSTSVIVGLIRKYVPLYFPSEQYQIERQSDGIHATAAGYSSWAREIWRWVK